MTEPHDKHTSRFFPSPRLGTIFWIQVFLYPYQCLIPWHRIFLTHSLNELFHHLHGVDNSAGMGPGDLPSGITIHSKLFVVLAIEFLIAESRKCSANLQICLQAFTAFFSTVARRCFPVRLRPGTEPSSTMANLLDFMRALFFCVPPTIRCSMNNISKFLKENFRSFECSD